MNGKSKWTSDTVTTWVPVGDGDFAYGHVQSSISLAPTGSHDGDHITITDSNEGGFGEHNDEGFGSDGSHLSDDHGFWWWTWRGRGWRSRRGHGGGR